MYRVTHLLVQNLLLTSKVKFSFSLAWPGQARPKRNLTFEVNGGFAQGDGSPCIYIMDATIVVQVRIVFFNFVSLLTSSFMILFVLGSSARASDYSPCPNSIL